MTSASVVAFDILARDRASGTLSKVGSNTSKMYASLGAMAKRAALGVGVLAGAGALVGIKTAAANEQAKIAFTTMLGSAKKADSFLRSLQSFAAKTPFEFPELQKASVSLISMGVDAKKVIPIMTTLGDVTAGMGTGSEGVQRATRAIQQMVAAGRIQAEDLNQLRDAGIPVYDALAASMGKSRKEVGRLVSSGDLARMGEGPVNALLKGLEVGKGLGRFKGLMEAQATSLTGMWSTLKDTFSQGMARAIQPVIPLLKDGMGGATTVLAKTIPAVVRGLASFISGIQSLAPFAAKVKGALSGMFDGVGGGSGVMKSIAAVVVPAFRSLADTVKRDLLPALQNIWPVVRPIGAFLLKLFGEALVGAFKGAVQAIKGLVQIVSGVLNLFSNLIHGRWGKLWGDLGQIVKGAGNLIVGVIKALWFGSILAIFRRGALFLVKGIWVKMWTGLKSLATRGWKQLGSLSSRAMSGLGRLMLNGIRGFLRMHLLFFKGLLSLARTGWKVLRSAFGGAMAAIRTVVARALGMMRSAFVNFFRLQVALFRNGWTAARNAVSGGISRVVGLVKSLPGRMKSAIGSLGGILRDAGSALIQGLIDGITSKIGALKDKLGSLTSMIPKLKGPMPVDRVLLAPNGRAIMGGLLEGIESQRGALRSTLAGVTSDISRTGGAMSAAASVGASSGASAAGRSSLSQSDIDRLARAFAEELERANIVAHMDPANAVQGLKRHKRTVNGGRELGIG